VHLRPAAAAKVKKVWAAEQIPERAKVAWREFLEFLQDRECNGRPTTDLDFFCREEISRQGMESKSP
jgi:hypothetical protein